MTGVNWPCKLLDMRRNARDIATQRAGSELNVELDRTGWDTYEDILSAVLHVKDEILRGTLKATAPTIAYGLRWNVRTAALGAVAAYSLTDSEIYQILTAYELSCTKYMLRIERHGDSNKEGGLE